MNSTGDNASNAGRAVSRASRLLVLAVVVAVRLCVPLNTCVNRGHMAQSGKR